MQQEFLMLGQYKVFHNNEISARDTLHEVIQDEPYKFIAQNDEPFIVDAGSNIGISTLYFKQLYPKAKILCFEADPAIFSYLKKNVIENNLQDITLVNAALAATAGQINFYGQVQVDQPDARGNSIIEAWGMQRMTSSKIQVAAHTLSSYINQSVDFLKLDIEGAEQQVLCELGDKLNLIKQIALEVHIADHMGEVNNLEKICALLQQYHFRVDVIKKNVADLLPAVIKSWADKVHPQLYAVNAVRK